MTLTRFIAQLQLTLSPFRLHGTARYVVGFLAMMSDTVTFEPGTAWYERQLGRN